MKVGDLIQSIDGNYVIVAVQSEGHGYGVPVTGNVHRYSWAFFPQDTEAATNIVDKALYSQFKRVSSELVAAEKGA